MDPGTRVLGYGILDVARGQRPKVVAHGALRLPQSPLASRLEKIFGEIGRIISAHAPQVLALEEVFYGKNFQSVLKVGEARGVVVLAAQMRGLEIREYSPALIKKSATGNGNAGKSQVQGMMQRVLGLREAPEPLDVTDALAAAFCHGQRLWRASLVSSPPRSRASASFRLPGSAGLTRRGLKRGGQTVKVPFDTRKARLILGKRFRKAPTERK